MAGAPSVVRGVPGAAGVAIGPAYQVRRAEIRVHGSSRNPAEEHARLQATLETARDQLIALHEQMLLREAGGDAAIFTSQAAILSDPELLGCVEAEIESGRSAAEAWQRAIEDRAGVLSRLADPLLAERAADVRDVGDRLLRLLVGLDDASTPFPDEPFVLIAYDLPPSEAAVLDPRRVLGFCTAIGGAYAHTAILARALGLPAVVSAGPRVLDVPDGTPVILDGGAGTLVIAPDGAQLEAARLRQRQENERKAAADRSTSEPAVTMDGHRVEVAANIGSLAGASAAVLAGAEGVGLLRTEFLFLGRSTPPDEEEQFAIYRDIALAMGGEAVIIRTLDIGGDKPLPYLAFPAEENPFLGERGIRLCMTHPDLLRVQLRAICRAAAFGPLRIMFPMIGDVGELRWALALLESTRAELNVPPIDVGIMIEVPSAALLAGVFAREVDFFSVGTNDLTQYALAIDRTHPTLAPQADGLHPAVLRLVEMTVRAAEAAGKWVGVCGELASDPEAVPILIGLGVTELSVSVPAIPLLKAQIRSLNMESCRKEAARALACATATEVREGAVSE